MVMAGVASPLDEDEIIMHKAIKAKVREREQEQRDAENARRVSKGLPPSRLNRNDVFSSRSKG